MNYLFLSEPAPPVLGHALEKFEAQFRYPLGEGASFSISHGRDYMTFFAAIGEATVVIAQEADEVVATLAAVMRPLRFPNGEVRTAVYFADLKIDPKARNAMLLLGLFARMREHLNPPADAVGYAVVMDGTGRTPSDYTGKMRIPSFAPIANITVLTLTTAPGDPGSTGSPLEEPAGYVPRCGNPTLRSELQPQSLATSQASGLLEDTRRGKRLVNSQGHEMRAAHLSRFVWEDAAAGATLLRHASARCHAAGIPTLFASVPRRFEADFLKQLPELEVQPAPATIYGSGFPPSGADWRVDSAEI